MKAETPDMGCSISTWFEELPNQCPDADAFNPSGQTFYRLIEGESITCEDFWSHRKIWPHKVFNTSECRARSISIFEEASQCARLLLLPAHKNKKIAAVNLSPQDGVVKRTGNQPGHHSWWRSANFNQTLSAQLHAIGA